MYAKQSIKLIGENFMNYDVSLIITTYNEEKYLPILLDSINNQKTDLKMEIIIIDDSSTDGTLNIIKQYDKFILGGGNSPFT